jgi:hypothetical protein
MCCSRLSELPPEHLSLRALSQSGFCSSPSLDLKTNMWLVAVGMRGHGVFDFLHHLFTDNSGEPSWWPGFCLTFDLLFAGWLAVLLMRRSHPSLSAHSFRPRGTFDALS